MRGFILLVLAILLSLVIIPSGFMYGLIYRCFKALDDYLFRIAKSIDQLGNVVCDQLFNDILIKKDGYQFGNEDKTISHVLGMNKKEGKLTFLGKLLEKLLDLIDKNHVEKSIEYGKKSN